MEFKVGDKVKPIQDIRSRYCIEGVLHKMDIGEIVSFYSDTPKLAIVMFTYKDGSKVRHNAYIQQSGDFIIEIEHYYSAETIIEDLKKLEEKWKT